jgi:uncharacterized membrane protein
MGYLYCLNLLREMPPGTSLINQHVVEPFSFSKRQIDLMIATLTKRKTLLAELFPWDEPNYGIDERWIRLRPYGQKAKPGQAIQISLRMFNHSDGSHKLTLSLNLPDGFDTEAPTTSITVPSQTEKQVVFRILIDASINPGTYVITADVQLKQWNLPRWTEAIVEVE